MQGRLSSPPPVPRWLTVEPETPMERGLNWRSSQLLRGAGGAPGQKGVLSWPTPIIGSRLCSRFKGGDLTGDGRHLLAPAPEGVWSLFFLN